MDSTKITNRVISNWVRQARYRAKKHRVRNNLTIEHVNEIVAFYEGCCAYCHEPADTLDHPFPVGSAVPNVAANALPCCKQCKHKKTGDLVAFFFAGHIEQERYVALIRNILAAKGGQLLLPKIRDATGFIDSV